MQLCQCLLCIWLERSQKIEKNYRSSKCQIEQFRPKENKEGITSMIWGDKGDVLFLSMKHSTKFVKTVKKKVKKSISLKLLQIIMQPKVLFVCRIKRLLTQERQ